MKKFIKIGCLSTILLFILFYIIGSMNTSAEKQSNISTTNYSNLKYQNSNLKSMLSDSDKRINSEFKFMSDNIISTNISISSSDVEEESKLARIVDRDLNIKGRYNVNTIQTFSEQMNHISMNTKYKGFEYVLDYYNNPEYEKAYKIEVKNGNVYGINIESGKVILEYDSKKELEK
jgi:hypothetical protein